MKLPDELEKRLEYIRTYVRGLWKDHKTSPFYFTPHDDTHSEFVENKIIEIIPDSKHDKLKEDEWFVLLASAWLHDIGMIPSLFDGNLEIPTKEEFLELRDKHHVRSRDYVINNQDTLNITKDEAIVIGNLCVFHRKKENICNCNDLLPAYRCQLLSAILRIADALHVDKTRVEQYQHLYNLFLTMGMPLSSEFHWIKSFCIRNTIWDSDSKKIIVNFYLSESNKISNQEILIKYILDEISEEINSIKDVINKSEILYYDNIEHTCLGEPSNKDKVKLKQIVSQLTIEYTASSSQLLNIIIDTINYIFDNSSDDESKSVVKLIQSYNDTEIYDLVKIKPCHVLITKIYNIINSCLLNESYNDDEKIQYISTEINKLQEQRSSSIRKIAIYAKSILADYGTILLFGYSEIVIAALKEVEEHIKKNTKIFVCECRSKNQYNYQNDLIYCDGMRYAIELSNVGFTDINLIPDIIAGNVINNDKIDKVIFGANVVDLDEKQIGHTAGHFSIIYAAKQSNIPIYIMVDSQKFGKINYDTDQQRTVKWFTGNKELLENLKKSNIKLFNPRSDVISLSDITTLVTEYGAFPPERASKRFKGEIT